jgi:Pumilio-family RNA binding repeat
MIVVMRYFKQIFSHSFGLQERAHPTTQYPTVDRNTPQGHGMGIYAPMASHSSASRPHPLPNGQYPQQHHPHIQYEQTNGHYGAHPSQPIQSQIHTQVLPSGHTVYVNAPSPQQYQGYATIQYHPNSQQHHIIHQTASNGMPGQPSEQYISVVPIPGGGHIQGVGPGGTYTYWQPPDGQPGGPRTVTIIPPGAGGVPVAVSHIANSTSGTPTSQKHRHHNQHRNQSHGGRVKDKGGRGRKNGGSTPGRKGGAAEAKSQSTNVQSHTASLLDDFKSKKNNRDWSVLDIKGNIVEFCKDQNGSRFIQQRLEVGSDEEKEIVISEVLPVIDGLRNDVFGNYVVQKLLDFGTDKMKADLRDTMNGEMVSLSLQMYG